MPTDDEEFEDEEETEDETIGSEDDPDELEQLAALSEEIEEHRKRLKLACAQHVAALGDPGSDTPERAAVRFLLAEFGETVLSLFADATSQGVDNFVGIREWADEEVEPLLDTIDGGDDESAAAGSADDGIAEVPVPVVQAATLQLGQLRSMVEDAMAKAPEDARAQFAQFREQIDVTVASLAGSLPDEPVRQAQPAAPTTQ